MAAKKAAEQAEQTAQVLRIEYMALSELRKRRHPDNPKDHDLGALDRSFDQFGFTSPPAIDERTGLIPFGHGREEALSARKQQGRPAPDRIIVKEDDWYVPVIRGLEFETEAQLRAYLVTDNRLTELGGWDEPALAELLQRLQESDHALFEQTGYDDNDLSAILRALTPANADDWQAALGGLAEGDRAPFQQMTFTLHDEQVEQVKAAMALAKEQGEFVDSPNENSNGNALARICETYLTLVGEHG